MKLPRRTLHLAAGRRRVASYVMVRPRGHGVSR